MATIYIDPTVSGTGTGTGTLGDPFKSWASVTWYYQQGHNYLQKEGTIFIGEVVCNNPGLSNARIYIGTYSAADGSIVTDPARRARIVGAGTTGTALAFNPAGARNYIDVCNLHLVGASSGTEKLGFNAYNSLEAQESNIRSNTVIGCEIEAPAGSGMWISGTGWTVRENEIHNCLNDGIFSRARDFIYEDNDIYDVDKGVLIGDCIQNSCLSNCGTSVIRYNRLQAPVGGVKQAIIVEDVAVGGVVRVYGNEVQGGGGSCVALGVVGALCYGNTIDGLGETINVSILRAGVKVTANIMKNGTYGLIFTVDDCTGVEFDGNTLVGTVERFVSVLGTVTGNAASVRNNVFAGLDNAAGRSFTYPPGNTVTSNYNAFSGTLAPFDAAGVTYNTLALYQAGTGQDANSITSDPLLSPSYRPLPGSPLIGAGTHLGYTRDLAGVQRPNPPSIGAYDVAKMRTFA